MTVPSAPLDARLTGPVSIRTPRVSDGAQCWRLAVGSARLDVNSRYAYVLWCRDFSTTSRVAWCGETAVGFVTGYRRPDQPRTLVVWQIAVAEQFAGRGVASAMLDELLAGTPGVDYVETTITSDNTASQRLFQGLARRHATGLERRELFSSALLGEEHAPEILHRIGPVEA